MSRIQFWENPQEEFGIWEGEESRRHFWLALRLCCRKNVSYMRNTSFVRTMSIQVVFLSLSMPLLACCPRTLPAQCSADSDPDSLACQDLAPLSSSTPTEEAPALLNLSGPNQRQPRADLSDEASATGSLPAGSAYTERPSRNRLRRLAPSTLPLSRHRSSSAS